MTLEQATAWQIGATLFAAGGLYVKLMAMNGDLNIIKKWKDEADRHLAVLLDRCGVGIAGQSGKKECEK